MTEPDSGQAAKWQLLDELEQAAVPPVSLLDVVDRFVAQVLANPGREVTYAEFDRFVVEDNPYSDYGAVNDPPGTGAQLLDALITDAQYDAAETMSLNYSDVHDTCPAGVGPGAVAVKNHHTGEAFLLVAVPLDRGEINRSAVRRLLDRHQPDVARVIGDAHRIIDQALTEAPSS